MARILYLLLTGLVAAQGLPDAAFDAVPFNQWLKGGEQSSIKFSIRILPARLTVYQRLAAKVSVQVDRSEFRRRKLTAFLEIRDSAGRAYRTHHELELSGVNRPANVNVNFDQYTFIKPGDYLVTAAVYDAASKEHAVKQVRWRLPPMSFDPLPEAWRDLPPVEFSTVPSDPPGRWYLPDISSRLFLPVASGKPVRVEVVVNESPTEVARRRTGRVSSRNMINLIPSLKVLSQMALENGSLNVTLLDLERHKVSFAQQDVKTLDWPRLRAALAGNDPNRIDARSLADHDQNAQFFVSEIRKLLEATETNGDVPLGLTEDQAPVLIVLSGPMAFPTGQDLRPIETTAEAPARIFYIRYYPPQGFGGFPGGGGRGMPAPGPVMIVQDSLYGTLKPLHPKLFEVTSPRQFRTALAAIMRAISTGK